MTMEVEWHDAIGNINRRIHARCKFCGHTSEAHGGIGKQCRVMICDDCQGFAKGVESDRPR